MPNRSILFYSHRSYFVKIQKRLTIFPINQLIDVNSIEKELAKKQLNV